jgi:D-lactate dehydrogenase (cytochrome)
VAQPSSGHDNPALSRALAALAEQFGSRAQTGAAIRAQHANATTWISPQPPDAVVWPESAEEVAAILAIARAAPVPVIPFGAGTSLEGHVNAPRGGICIDMQRMNRVVDIRPADLDCTVEAGVSRRQLNEALRPHGLFFPVDPGAEDATLGGMAATRASGTCAVRYGTMRDNVVGLQAVMADGTIIETARRARKSSAGFDLTRLLVGSEGTLGIITRLTLRLFGVPETIAAAVCPFASVEGACNATIEATQLGLGLARIEFLDAAQIRAVNGYSNLALAETPTLFLEFHGGPAAVRESVAAFEEIARANGACRFDWAEDESERRRLWKARHDAYWAIRATAPGRAILATDVCVPISSLGACIAETQADAQSLGLFAPILGHVGDGNFHATPLFDAQDPQQVAAVEQFLANLVARALAMDGTCTGEHGVGQGKRGYLRAELGGAVDVMAKVKQALDPGNILNPGKMLPEGALGDRPTVAKG